MPSKLDVREVFSLRGRIALVTGGGRGLGRTLAEALAAAGASVVLAGRTETTLACAAAEIAERYAVDARPHCVDLSRPHDVIRFADDLLQEVGRVDVLVHNAGYEGLEPVDLVSEENLSAILETNLVAAIRLTKAFVPAMKANGWGRLIYLTSATTAAASVEGHSVYTASKSALEGFARTVAVELGRHGVTANCISPGTYLTNQARGVLESFGAEQGNAIYESFAAMTAVGRWGEPEDLVGALLLLASDAGRYVTGEVLRVDGGLAVKLRPS